MLVNPFNPLGDTANFQLFRNPAGKVIAMTIKPNTTGGPLIYDSIAYAYSPANRLSSYVYFSVLRVGTSATATPFQKYELTYSGNNVTQRLEYQLYGALQTPQLIETINLQYDEKPATRALSEEEYMLELAPVNVLVPAVNNILRIEFIPADNPNDRFTTVYAYVYGTNNKPATAKVTTTFAVAGVEIKSTMKFFYN